MYGGCASATQSTIENFAEPMCQCLVNSLCGFCKCVEWLISGGSFDGGAGGDWGGGGGCGRSKWIVWLDRQRKQENGFQHILLREFIYDLHTVYNTHLLGVLDHRNTHLSL